MAKYEDEDEDVQRIKNIIKLVLLGVVCLFIIIALFGTFYTIDAGARGVILTWGAASTNIKQPGLHMKIPFVQKLIIYSVRTQTIQFDNKLGTGDNSEFSSLFAASKDLQSTQTAIVCNFHINEQDVINIYRQYGDNSIYNQNIIEPIIRDTVKSVSAQYSAEELVTRRPEVAQKATELLSQRFASKNAILDNLNIVNFEFSKEYSTAIEAKAVQIQNLEQAKVVLETTKVQADTRIAQAEGEAKAIQIQTIAINSQGGAAYVQLQAIRQWNGVLPIIFGSSSLPFIDMRTLTSSNIVTTNNNPVINVTK